jgi:NADPH:quinone reductase-like Zn-dependent oxidoreductase
MASEVPKTMKAWQFSSAFPTIESNLKLNNNAPLPDGASTLQPDQVLVKVIAAGLNPVDFKFAEIPWLGRLIVGSPSTPAMDFAGRVVATGHNTKKSATADLKPGQLVFGRLDIPSKFGTLAEYTIAPRKGCVALPPCVSPVDAVCSTSVALTAYQSIVHRMKYHAGKRVFINGGSGGCGTFGIQIAKAMGCHVVTSCSTPNIDLCRSLGADVVIDYKDSDLVAELKSMQPFDLVVDNVGIPTDLYWVAPSFTNPGAPYVQVGALAVTPAFILGNFFKARWPGWLGGGKRPWEFMHIQNNVQDYAQLGQWMQEGKLRAIVDQVFDMEDKGPVKAYQKLRTGRARGKIIVKIEKTQEE